MRLVIKTVIKASRIFMLRQCLKPVVASRQSYCRIQNMGPKKAKAQQTNKDNDQASTSKDVPVQCAINKVREGVSISIHAKPGAKCSAITGIDNESIHVQIGAKTKEGEANNELVEFLAQTLGIKKGKLSLITGFKSRDKRVLIQGEENVQKIMDILKNSM